MRARLGSADRERWSVAIRAAIDARVKVATARAIALLDVDAEKDATELPELQRAADEAEQRVFDLLYAEVDARPVTLVRPRPRRGAAS